MNKIFTKIASFVLGLGLAVGVGVGVSSNKISEARADTTYSFTPDNATTGNSSTTYVTSDYEFTVGEAKWKFNQWNPKNLQIKTNQGSATGEFYFFQTKAFSGPVTSVSIKFSALSLKSTSSTGMYIVGGASAFSSAQTSGGTQMSWNSDSKTLSCTLDASNNYKAIAFYQNGKVASGTNNLATSNAITITYQQGEEVKLNSITGIEGTLEANQGDSAWDLSGLTPTGTLSDDTTKEVDISDYVTLSTDDVPGSAGDTTVSVTVTPKAGSVTAKSFDVDATVFARPVYSESMLDWEKGDEWYQPASSSFIGSNAADKVRKSTLGKEWRLSSSIKYNAYRILGERNATTSTSVSGWSDFKAKKYYSSIAEAMTGISSGYAFAMYTKNFSITGLNRIDIDWVNFVNSGTLTSFLLASKNGGYSFEVLSKKTGTTDATFKWSDASKYSSSDNVIVALAFHCTALNAQIENFNIDLYGDSLNSNNVWAAREVSISGNTSVEAAQTITLSASVVTTGYETPANTNISWESSNTEVATVENGVVTGVSAGSATITAKAADGYGAQATKSISVTPKLKRIDHIELDTTNVQKSFVRGSQFNSTGLVVTAYYSNGFDPEPVSPTSVVPPTMTVAGENLDVTVTYSVNGTSDTKTYKITITPKVSSEIEISGEGVSFNDDTQHYEITTMPDDAVQLTINKDGDETSYSASTTNDDIYVDESDSVLYIESTENDTGTVTLTCGNATAYLDVTVVADESYTTNPADGKLSGIVHQTLEFSVYLYNVTEAEWDDEPTAEAYEIVGDGDESGYFGLIELKQVCTKLEFTLTVETSKNTFNIVFELTATADSITGISVKSAPSKTTYTVGESFAPAGLVIEASRTSGVPVDLLNTEYTLNNPTTFTVRGTVTITATLVADGTKSCSFSVTVNMPSGLKILVREESAPSWTKVTSAPSDWSGEYLLAYNVDDSNAKVWTGVDAASGCVNATVSSNAISSVPEGASTITIASMTDGYSIKVNGGGNNGKYIYGTSGKNALNFGANASANTISYDSDSVKIVSNTSVLRFNSSDSDNRFRYYKSETYSAQKAVQLYKKTAGSESYSLYDVSTTMYDFILDTYNNPNYYTCKDSGVGSVLTNWNNASKSDKWNSLSATDKTRLANCVVEHEGVSSCKIVADYISQYDYVVGKYHSDTNPMDYLNRIASGQIVALNPRTSVFGLLSDGNNASTIAIVVVSVLAVTAIGGYFFIRKRKELN